MTDITVNSTNRVKKTVLYDYCIELVQRMLGISLP
jgi:hypothetical protein